MAVNYRRCSICGDRALLKTFYPPDIYVCEKVSCKQSVRVKYPHTTFVVAQFDIEPESEKKKWYEDLEAKPVKKWYEDLDDPPKKEPWWK